PGGRETPLRGTLRAQRRRGVLDDRPRDHGAKAPAAGIGSVTSADRRCGRRCAQEAGAQPPRWRATTARLGLVVSAAGARPARKESGGGARGARGLTKRAGTGAGGTA